MWRLNDPQGNEAQKIKYDIVPYTRGRGLDIGCGPYKAYTHFIGVDNGHHWGTQGADVVSEATDLSIFADNSLDFVFSSHLLEHIQDTQAALKEWFRVIKPGGYLCLYLPDDKLYPKVGERGANPDHKHNLNQRIVLDHMRNVGGWNLVEDELRDHDNGPDQPGNEYSFYQVYQKRNDNKQKFLKKIEKKKVCVCRYGGFGDMIQTSSVLPGLKAQGYHVTVMTTPRGYHILQHDPNIDAWIIQDKDQVPNEELSWFFKAWAKKFHKFINLCESVEGTLLAMPGRVLYEYPKELRHNLTNINYLERTHDIAEVPHKFSPKFYPSKDELDEAKKYRKDLGQSSFVILWSLAGSSMHKVSPWVDKVIARLLIVYDNIKIILVGDDYCRMLEGSSWENEPRVICKSGEWPIRFSLTFSQVADLVVGSETGLLNCAGHEDVPKVIALSHSTHENLTKHWKNTTVLTPKVNCYPCHKMHYGKGSCPWVKFDELPQGYENELTGNRDVTAPACTVDIDAGQYFEAIRNIIEVKRVGNVGQL